MNPVFNNVLVFVGTHLATLAATVLGMIAAALLAYFRGQMNAGTKWALAPITRRLPWNWNRSRERSPLVHESGLNSELTVVDVFLTSMDGRTARYQKTVDYLVNRDSVHSYREGVTGSGTVSGFTTLVGTITETTREHGFYISRIDLGDLLSKGFQLQNIFTADLHDCFTAPKSTGLKRSLDRANVSRFEFISLSADRQS